MTASISTVDNVQTVPVVQNKNAIKRKKSQAPAIGAIIGTGVGAVRATRAVGAASPFINSIAKEFRGSGRLGLAIGAVLSCAITAAEGAGIGAIVSLFTRKSREEAAIAEHNAQFDQNV